MPWSLRAVLLGSISLFTSRARPRFGRIGPRSHGRPLGFPSSTAPIGREPLDAPKVLIADDSPLVLRMIEKALQGAGLSVVTARDGLEAIEKALSEDVGLVILDVMMPRMNGYQTCRL